MTKLARLLVALAVVGAAAIVPGHPAGMEVAAAASMVFITPGTYSYVVPPDVVRLDVEMTGASGQDVGMAPGGRGALVQTELTVVAGELLTIEVGGQGTGTAYEGTGTAGSTVSFSGNGGGGSYVSRGSAALVAAGGGGGAGLGDNLPAGGSGGPIGGSGESGYRAFDPDSIGGGGSGGTTESAGSGGSSPHVSCEQGSSGSGQVGGDGPGGGGGGGYFGGGAGSDSCYPSATGAGGGGSSFAPPGAVVLAGERQGDGYVTLVPASKASEECTSGTIFDGTSLGVYTKVRLQQVDATTTKLCFRIDAGFTVRYGGVFTIDRDVDVTPPDVLPPSRDDQSAACTTPANQLPLAPAHPFAEGQIGDPGGTPDVSYLIDAYHGPGLTGTGEFWFCLQVQDVDLRVIVPTGGYTLPSVTLPSITFTPDPGTPDLF